MKLIKFQDLSFEEKVEVWQWRNDKSIRKWMFHQQLISLQEHLKFIDTLSDKKIYLKVEDIGVVNFKNLGDFVEIGLHKNPNKNNVGSKLLAIAIDYAFTVLQAKKILICVLKNNKRALHIYRKFGFIETAINKNIITMELIDENWQP